MRSTGVDRLRLAGIDRLRLAVCAAALLPAIYLVWRAGFGDLGPNPIETVTRLTGRPALVLLMLALAATPLNTALGWKALLKVRRGLGLFACAYAGLHLLVFVGLDYGFDLPLIRDDALIEKPYIIVGFTSFAIMSVLALTSTKGWTRRLGRNWKRLHRLVYIAGVLAAVHYLWLVKALTFTPVACAAVIALLLLARVPAVRRALARHRPGGRATSPVSERGT